jgi:hypothetical protein
VEAVSTVGVLALTAALASTAPAASGAAQAAPTATRPAASVVEMSLGEGRTALLTVDLPTTRGSRLGLELVDADGRPLDAAAARLQATLPERDLGPLPATLIGGPSKWSGELRFPLPGEWDLTLTVQERGTGLVTAGAVRIGEQPTPG